VKPTQQLHELGQSIWIDNITRGLLDDGTIANYIAEYSVTGLTSNPSIFEKAIGTGAYDDAIAALAVAGKRGEELFFDLAVEDLQRAADLFAPAHTASDGVDGFVSLEVSPKLAYDAASTVKEAAELHGRAGKDNLFIKIPGTEAGLPAIEETIAAGIPVNVTLLFSAEQYIAAAGAYLKGIERRVDSGLDPNVGSVASVFMSRWDKAVEGRIPAELENKLALAVGGEIYRAYHEIMDSDRWQRLAGEGARMQRLLWASTSTKTAGASDTLYVTGLAAPNTVNTMPDVTLEAFHDHGMLDGVMATDGGDCDAVLDAYAAAGIDKLALAATLQTDGADAFVQAWDALIGAIGTQTAAVN
jgi:transaldolase